LLWGEWQHKKEESWGYERDITGKQSWKITPRKKERRGVQKKEIGAPRSKEEWTREKMQVRGRKKGVEGNFIGKQNRRKRTKGDDSV